MTNKLGIADAIEGLRNDLQQAIEKGRAQALRFTLSPIELTLNLVATKEGSAKIGWQVVGLGGSAEKETTHTLKVTLTPSWHAADGTALTAEQFTIAARVSGPVKIGAGEGVTP